MFNIRENLKKLPNKPGVYIMKDESNTILYVGKAIDLKNRVNWYFRKNKKTKRIEKMVSKIDSFEYIITDNEVEALILECNLIKKHKPHYNVMLKDDKSYPYIKINLKEKFPRVYLTRRFIDDGSKYYGPFTDVSAVNEFMKILKNIFPIRNCKKNLKDIKKKERPCLNYHIKRCLAPCAGEVSEQDYIKMIKNVEGFLSGRYDDITKDIKIQMEECSDNLEFEKAAVLRDRLKSIEKVAQRQNVSKFNGTDTDVIGIVKIDGRAMIAVLEIRGGKLLGQVIFAFEDIEEDSEKDLIEIFMKQFYDKRLYLPNEILLRYEIEGLDVLEEWLCIKKGSKVRVRVVKKGSNSRLLDMAEKNAKNTLCVASDAISILVKLQDFLKLEKVPEKIEAYDISNIGNDNIVGSMITILDGKFENSLYRKFKLKTVSTQDDISATYEVLSRRLDRSGDSDVSFRRLPDLILADGGQNQVNAIKRAISERGIDIEVAGMVKNDKHRSKAIYFKGRNISILKNSDILKFISGIQDEVHRVAISYNKLLRSKDIKKSELDNIKGIGDKRKKELLKYFGSVDKIKKASVEELTNVPGINKSVAYLIKEYYKGV